MDSWWRRWWVRVSGPRGRQVGVCLIALLAAAGGSVAEWINHRTAEGWVTLAVGLVGTVALWWRQRHPIPVLLIGIPLVIVSNFFITLGFGLFSLAIVRRDRLLIGMTVVAAAAFSVPTLIGNQPLEWADLISGTVGALIFVLWGAYIGTRRDLLSSLRDRAARAEQERESRAEQARATERARIAREMHDVVAHKVSLIALQAGGLEVNPGIGAPAVEEVAGRISATARQAMEDLRHVLGVLRSDGAVELAPQPGIDDLPRLVESSRAAGVQVGLTIDCPPLPDHLGRAVHRIVREALTNVHKHARGAATQVRVLGDDRQVFVEVINQRPVAAGSLLPGSGSGLIGLGERVTVEGGELVAGPTPDGGWRLRATLPLPDRPTPPPPTPSSPGGYRAAGDRPVSR